MKLLKINFTKRRWKRQKLANLLLKNYITSFLILFFILLFSVASAILFAVYYFKITFKSYVIPENFISTNYEEIINEVVEAGGGLVTINDNFEVTSRHGNTSMLPNKISLELFGKISKRDTIFSPIKYEETNEEIDNYVYTIAYDSQKKHLTVCIIPADKYSPFSFNKKSINKLPFLFIYLAITTFLFLGVLIVYSRATSTHFVKPLKLLTEGANRIASGSYSTRIRINANNEFGELRDSFNIMAQKIEEETLLRENSEEARKRLILDISHDLKNPLASILGYSDYLLNTDISEEDKNLYLKVINRNAARANDLIQDLFEYSKLDSIDFELSYSSEDINEFIRSLIASYIPFLEENQFDYEFVIPETTSIVEFSSKHLDRALSNLILNAVKYNKKGIKLFIKTYVENNTQFIIVEDNGIGIDKNLIETIFDPFVRADESRNSENGGTGLGLAITKKIIEMHGGTISLDSDLNLGCKFKISLPLKKSIETKLLH